MVTNPTSYTTHPSKMLDHIPGRSRRFYSLLRMLTNAVAELTGDRLLIFGLVAFISAYIIFHQNSRIRKIERQLRDAGASLSTMAPSNQIPTPDRQPSPESRSSRRPSSSRRDSRQASPDTEDSRQRQRRRERQTDLDPKLLAKINLTLYDALERSQRINEHLAQAAAQRAATDRDFQERYFALVQDYEEIRNQIEEADRWREGMLDDVQYSGGKP